MRPKKKTRVNDEDQLKLKCPEYPASQHQIVPVIQLSFLRSLLPRSVCGHRHKIFLENLQRNYTRPGSTVFSDQFYGVPLFRRCGLIVSIDKNIGVKKPTNAHGSLRD